MSPERFHNILSLASSPPLSSHTAGGNNTQLNPTALEFVPGKEYHDRAPNASTIEQASTPSFAQVHIQVRRLILYYHNYFYRHLVKERKK